MNGYVPEFKLQLLLDFADRLYSIDNEIENCSIGSAIQVHIDPKYRFIQEKLSSNACRSATKEETCTISP